MFLELLDEVAAGIDLGGAPLVESPVAELLRSGVGETVPELDPVALLVDLQANGFVVVEQDRTSVPDATGTDRRYQVATTFLAAVVSSVLAACPSPGAIVGAVLSPAASAGCRALAMLPGQTCIVLGALPGQLWGAWAALCALAAWTAASL